MRITEASLTLKSSSFIASLVNFGGPGLVLIGLVDNSAIPLPSGMDILMIWLLAGHRRSWIYYALMATAGSLFGAYVTYALGKRGGREALEKKLPRRKVQSGYKRYEKWGFWSVFAATLIPPPFPIAAAWLTAGAMRYSVTKFLGAVASGRSVRYSIIAYLASRHSQIGSFVANRRINKGRQSVRALFIAQNFRIYPTEVIDG
ncbi:MAG: hypothetical protein DMG93_20735 [Acidobacteria bacterium]|nr:MAG: hypothetical protein DMG93_20735 [Acidobacteriota bacterium]